MSAACYTDTSCGACSALQPTYRAYAHAQGQPCAEAQLRADQERYPGGCMTGFVLWMAAGKRVAARLREGSVYREAGAGDLRVWDAGVWHHWVRMPANWPAINAEAGQ